MQLIARDGFTASKFSPPADAAGAVSVIAQLRLSKPAHRFR
jgi:hypothetical protein